MIILKIIFSLGFTILTILMIKVETKRKDIDVGITYRNGSSQCKGENVMMLISMWLGLNLLVWAL